MNKFICRGITKTNKFVYGYYYFDPMFGENGGRFIFEEGYDPLFDFSRNRDFIHIITQEPDRFIGLYDKNDKPLFINDKYIRYDAPRFKYYRAKIANKLEISYGEFEIVGNTHNIKEK